MTNLLASSTATGPTATEGDVKTYLANLRTFIADLLGTDSTNKAAVQGLLGNILNGKIAKTSAYTVVAADRGKVIDCSGAWTLSITAAATLGDGFCFAVVNSGSGIITIDPNLSESVNGIVTYAILPTETVLVFCDGTKFILFGKAPASIVNSIAGFTGDVSGSQLISSLYGTLVAGNKFIPAVGSANYALQRPSSSSSPLELFNFRVLSSGSLRISFTMTGGDSDFGYVNYARIYKNGAPVGTQRSYSASGGGSVNYSEDISVAAGDTIQILAWASSGTCKVNNVLVGTSVYIPFNYILDLIAGQR